jgi:hypothetical protein
METIEGQTYFFTDSEELISHWEKHLVDGMNDVINGRDESTVGFPEDKRQWIIDNYRVEIEAVRSEGADEMSPQAIQARIFAFGNEKRDIISGIRHSLIEVR